MGRCAGRRPELEVDDAILKEGLQDGGCCVAEGGFVREEGVDVSAEEGEEAALFMSLYFDICKI